MNDDDDLELQALRRQLDDAFETTRPRAGFEDALWARMQARRPAWQRLRDFLSGLVETVREVPAVPAAAVAAVLVLAIGVGVLSFGGFHFGGAGSTTSLSSGAQPGAAQNFNGSGGFGRLPSPGLQTAPTADTGAPKAAAPSNQSATNLYLGPAKLIWAGQLYVRPGSLPVYRYQEPTTADADRFAAGLGASPTTRPAGTLGDYAGDGFVLGVTGSSRKPPSEPTFFLTPDRSRLPAAGATATDTATAFLSAHSVSPVWPYLIAVDQVDGVTRVSYLWQFAVSADPVAFVVNQWGERYGLEVDLKDGQPLQAIGPLPLNLETADYPIISADQAIKKALASSASAPASAPTVRLTDAELVYVLVNAGDRSFYEPAFLFSGTFPFYGATHVKRVLVPAIAS
ncbi:MAG TPA: hypothetical protein VF383_03965 [Candidatus Dormibacteraeota bacterium]